MQVVQDNLIAREDIYRRLMTAGSGSRNSHYLASMISSAWSGLADMPRTLGLGTHQFIALIDRHFPDHCLKLKLESTKIAEDRTEEFSDLIELLLTHQANRSSDENALATIIVTGCMGSNHLWQDLGLWSRSDLSEMIALNFQSLADKNNRNMKWKRFFYKQLCEGEGVYVCRSPSCEVCADYSVCFAPEA